MKRKTLKAITTFVFVMTFAVFVSAQQTVIVTPTNLQGWTGIPPGADTRPGGFAGIVGDNNAPFGGNGSLSLTTNNTGTAKAQFMHAASLPLAGVTSLSYYTRQNSAPFPGAAASYQLVVCLDGFNPALISPSNGAGCVNNSFTTLVFEPYQNNGTAPPSPVVVPNVWQPWDVDAGQLWSSRTYSNGTCSVAAGFGGAPFYSIGGLSAACPNAFVVGFGVNIGSNNPNYNVSADLIELNGVITNFELFEVAINPNQCKGNNWMNTKRANGSPFKNQGDCMQYINTGK